MRACEVSVVVEGKEIISMNEQAHSGHKDAICYTEEILECAEMLIAFCGGRESQQAQEEICPNCMNVRFINVPDSKICKPCPECNEKAELQPGKRVSGNEADFGTKNN